MLDSLGLSSILVKRGLNNPNNPVLKSTLVQLVYSTALVDFVDVKEHRKLTPSDSNKPVVLPFNMV